MKTKSMPSLADKWALLKEKNPKIRIRNAAHELGVSEAQLLSTGCGGGGVVRLAVAWRDFLGKELPTLGVVRAITRNDHVVHERVGRYENPDFKEGGHVGLFVSADIDLRLFLHHWHAAFSVTETTQGKTRRSLQFFDPQGGALHKIYLMDQSDQSAFGHITRAYVSQDQSTEQPTAEAPAAGASPHGRKEKKGPLDIPSFQAAWLALKDTHDFHMLLHRFGVSRLEALAHAPLHYQGTPSGRHALRVTNMAFRSVVTQVAASGMPIMVFVANKGMLQIHTGPVGKLLDTEGWFNIVDPEFNLHVREEAIARSWVVRKPTEDGIVSSLEIFDEKGNLLCTLFGKRKPGIKENPAWRGVVDALEDTHVFSS